MPRFFIKRPDIKPRAQSQPILAIDTLSCAVSCELPCSITCVQLYSSSVLVFHSCSLQFTRVLSCSIRVHSCSIRVHSCSLVFTSVHSCSDSCGVLDQIEIASELRNVITKFPAHLSISEYNSELERVKFAETDCKRSFSWKFLLQNKQILSIPCSLKTLPSPFESCFSRAPASSKS